MLINRLRISLLPSATHRSQRSSIVKSVPSIPISMYLAQQKRSAYAMQLCRWEGIKVEMTSFRRDFSLDEISMNVLIASAAVSDPNMGKCADMAGESYFARTPVILFLPSMLAQESKSSTNSEVPLVRGSDDDSGV